MYEAPIKLLYSGPVYKEIVDAQEKQIFQAMQQQALCHEWLHGALVMLGFNEESQNEQFVQALSMAINQTFTVKEGGA